MGRASGIIYESEKKDHKSNRRFILNIVKSIDIETLACFVTLND